MRRLFYSKCCRGKLLVKRFLLVCYSLTKTLIASMYGVTPLEVLICGDVNVHVFDFVRDKGGCSSLSLEGFFTYISSVYFRHILRSVLTVAPRDSESSSLVAHVFLHIFHADEAGLFCSVPGHAIVTSSNSSVVGIQWVSSIAHGSFFKWKYISVLILIEYVRNRPF